MKNILILLIVLLHPVKARAYDLAVFEPTLCAMEAHKYMHPPHIPNMGPFVNRAEHALSVYVDHNLIRFGGLGLFHQNRFHLTTTDEKKVRHVGWEYRLGLGLDFAVNKRVEVGYYHHSEHVVETFNENFPLKDAYFLKVIFLRK